MDNGVEPKQAHMETLPVKLGLGPLWDMALWKFRFVVRQQTLNKEKQRLCFSAGNVCPIMSKAGSERRNKNKSA